MSIENRKPIPVHFLAGRTVVELVRLRAPELAPAIDMPTQVAHVSTETERSEATERLFRLRRRVA